MRPLSRRSIHRVPTTAAAIDVAFSYLGLKDARRHQMGHPGIEDELHLDYFTGTSN
jgi:hypothetical protein